MTLSFLRELDFIWEYEVIHRMLWELAAARILFFFSKILRV